jgi:hypothetical protein
MPVSTVKLAWRFIFVPMSQGDRANQVLGQFADGGPHGLVHLICLPPIEKVQQHDVDEAEPGIRTLFELPPVVACLGRRSIALGGRGPRVHGRRRIGADDHRQVGLLEGLCTPLARIATPLR